MVKWLHSHDNGEEEVYVAAWILLFGHLSDNENDSIPPKIVAVIHSLIDFHTPQDSLLFFAKGDSLDEGGPDIIDATAIEETAFVLPCVKDQGDDFPTSHDTANYFIVFPPQWSSGFILMTMGRRKFTLLHRFSYLVVSPTTKMTRYHRR